MFPPALTGAPSRRRIAMAEVYIRLPAATTNSAGLVESLAMDRQNLLSPREAAQILGISYPTLKQWIYKGKIRTIKTAGGHHRIPEDQIDKFLYHPAQGGEVSERRSSFRRLSGRNQLVGRVVDIKVSGLMAQVTLSIGGQRITSIITADAVREMRLKKGQTAAALVKSTEVMILRV